MAETRRDRLVQRLKGVRFPRRTVRLRLTLLYGSLFLASTGVLLAITYFVVRNLTGDSFVTTKNGFVIGGASVGGGNSPALRNSWPCPMAWDTSHSRADRLRHRPS